MISTPDAEAAEAFDAETVEIFDAEAVNAKSRRESLYASRPRIHPKRATGYFRRLKWVIMVLTLTIYYVTPWLKWDRGAHAPDQAVLVDLEGRRFFFFMIEIWPQEFYYVAGLLMMSGLGLFFVTSSFGRAWCGYACPQTVWVDLFLVVERFLEGDRNARIKLDKTAWTFDKIRKKVTKHAVWLLIGVATGGAWIFYFADAPGLAVSFVTGTAPLVAYATVLVLTATTYVLGGLMREQVCTYMCPWPRIQGAMLDAHSLVVTYNDWRGEPRRPRNRKDRREDRATGDCVDCNACVAVCPMGIDIRDGQQLECITCALCIDACDAVMDKIGSERGLIAYATFDDYEHNLDLARGPDTAIDPGRVRDGGTGGLFETFRIKGLRSVLRPRTFVYFAVWSLIGIAMLTMLALRGNLDVNVLHDRNPVAVQLSNGDIRNGYTVKILNKRSDAGTFRLGISGLPGAGMILAGSQDAPGDTLSIDAQADGLGAAKVYVRAAPGGLAVGRNPFRFIVTNPSSGEQAVYDAWFEIPPRQAGSGQ